MKTLYLNIFIYLIIISFTGCVEYNGYEVEINVYDTKALSAQDSTVKVVFEKVIYRKFRCTINNLKDSVIFIDFDYCTFVNQKGYTYQILSGFTTFGNIEEGQRIITIPPFSKYYAIMYPKELTYFLDKEYVTDPVFQKAKVGDLFNINIAYRVNDKSSPVRYFKIPLNIVRAIHAQDIE